ncbi:hypothetical protein ACWEQ2_38750 [Streptomyces sp. NPDC004096]
MRSFTKKMISATAGLTLTLGLFSATMASASAAASIDSNAWYLCKGVNLTGDCLKATGKPWRVPNMAGINGYFNDAINSIHTNSYAIETWSDANFKGAYGYFAPNNTWNSLSTPYVASISSFSTPGQ